MLERPPIWNRPRQRGLAVALAVALVAAAVVYRDELGGRSADEHDAVGPGDRPVAFYTCAMDPSVESDHPGTCPICGMALTPVSKAERTSGVVRIAAPTREMMDLVVAPVAIKPQIKRVVASGEVVRGDAGADRAAIAVRVYRGDPTEVTVGHRVHASVPELPVTQFVGTVAARIPGDRPGDPPGGLALVVDDPGHELEPGMHVEAELALALAPRLVVPAEAVLYAGARRIVFVERSPGQFEPRAVKLGVTAGGLAEVREGVAAGDPVVVKGMFLLAAESRLRSDSPLWDDRPPAAPLRPAPGPQMPAKASSVAPLPPAPAPAAPGTAAVTLPRSARP